MSSFYGYKRKTKPALWTTLPGAVVSEKPEPKRARRQSKVARVATECYRADAVAHVAEERATGKRCPVVALLVCQGKLDSNTLDRLAEDHHWAGRGYGGRGPLLLDRRLRIAMSSVGHRYVHDHPVWARRHNFMAPLGQWNVPVPPDAVVTRLPNGGIRVEV